MLFRVWVAPCPPFLGEGRSWLVITLSKTVTCFQFSEFSTCCFTFQTRLFSNGLSNANQLRSSKNLQNRCIVIVYSSCSSPILTITSIICLFCLRNNWCIMHHRVLVGYSCIQLLKSEIWGVSRYRYYWLWGQGKLMRTSLAASYFDALAIFLSRCFLLWECLVPHRLFSRSALL